MLLSAARTRPKSSLPSDSIPDTSFTVGSEVATFDQKQLQGARLLKVTFSFTRSARPNPLNLSNQGI
ncbi:hypothetical protein MA16_Dca014494 [Dendrobium catenatum]|uniref:Uncharacterized protein n=1 Tax=Dendrobium catenatum TaxID=906689 RepID=A0A2I0W334_9ASPA|nr:hypothetical protein MA16_Dca014494 [Dendrobium catenatum]